MSELWQGVIIGVLVWPAGWLVHFYVVEVLIATVRGSTLKVIDWPEDKLAWRRFYVGGRSAAVSLRAPRTLVYVRPWWAGWRWFLLLILFPVVFSPGVLLAWRWLA